MRQTVTRIGVLMMFLMSVVTLQAQIVDTGQTDCYDDRGMVISCPGPGSPFFGQDGNYQGMAPAYQDNGDGTITDLNTGLMWQQSPGPKISHADALATADSLTLGGYDDWRVPTIKELYTLILFTGVTGMTEAQSVPYLDRAYFEFQYGNEAAGERLIDAQYWSSTKYVSTTMNDAETIFGVNFADGRIKGYPLNRRDEPNHMFVRYVRGDSYGVNQFIKNGDGTITDESSRLMWMQSDSGTFNAGSRGDGSLNWEEALDWCENLTYADYTDWRLPNAKELQYIVDYSRSPATIGSAAIDPVFAATAITNEGGEADFPFYWTGTSHLDGQNPGDRAVYIAFGTASGYMSMPPDSGNAQFMDVHGAGSQRSDPKTGDPANFAGGRGPQGDEVRIYNYARCVRGGDVQAVTGDGTVIPQQDTGNTGQQPPQGQQSGNNTGQQPPQQQQPPQGQQPGNNTGQQPGQGPGQGPPQEALDACVNVTQGDACSFQAPQGQTITGTCTLIPSQQLACVPAGGPPGGGAPPGGGQ